MSSSAIKTRTKLIFMVAIPILGLLYFSITSTLEKVALSREMAKLESLAGVSVKIGALAHELQKERGMSAGFLGSKGAKFAAELPAQRKETDRKIEEFRIGLASFDDAKFDPSLKAMLDKAEKELNELRGKREGVTALTIPTPEAIGFYTRTIGQFLAVPGQTPILSSNSEVARAATTYSSLLQAKERAGIERATLSNVFTVDKFTPDMLARFLSNSAAQETFTGLFLNFALPEQKAFYDGKVTGDAVNEVDRLKKQAIDKAAEPSLGGVDTAIWFSAMTTKINLLKEVEDRLAEDLIGTAQRLQKQAAKMMLFYIILTVLSISATLLTAAKLIRSLLRQLGGEPANAANVAHNIAAGKLDNIIQIKNDDSTSLMASMKTMQDSLNQIVAEIQSIVQAAVQGDFSNKMDMDGKQGYTKTLSELLNQLSETTNIGLNDVMRVANALAAGDLSQKITQDYPGVFGQTKDGVNSTVDSLTKVVAEIQQIVEAAANRGDFSIKMDMSGKQGYTKTLAELLNQLSDVTDTGLRDIMRVANALAEGDLTQTITKDYPGLFGETKDGINTTVENLKKLVDEIKECGGRHQHRLQGNRRRQQRPVATHRRTGLQPGRNRFQHGRTDLHREAERRQRQAGQPAGHRRLRRRRQGRCRGQPGGATPWLQSTNPRARSWTSFR